MYDAKTETYAVSQILKKNFSEYRLPIIQRGFVWDEEDVKEFIESLLKGYPVGVITVVKTELDMPSIPFIDLDGSNYSSDVKYYVLDGQQRLTSLLLIKNGWKIKRDGEIIELRPICYNPDKKELRVKGRGNIGIDFSSIIKQILLEEKLNESIQKTLQEIDRNFLDRNIPFYVIEIKGSKPKEEMYRDMAEIFTRINRSGVRLGNLEMFLSFFASTGLGKENITYIYREMNKKYGMDLEPIIRFIFSNFGLNQNQIAKVESFKKAVNDLGEKYNNKQSVKIINECKRAIEKTMDFLRNELGIVSVNILPSENTLIPIFQYFYDKKDVIKENEKREILYWFLVANFNGVYSSSIDKRLEEDLKIMKEERSDGKFPTSRLLDSMDKKIRIREINKEDFKNIEINILRGNAGKRYLLILYVLLHRKGSTDWAGNKISENYNNLAKHHIFPKDLLIEKGYDDDNLINHLGNITFVNSEINLEIQNEKPEEYLKDYSKILKYHFIPLDENLWKVENYKEFIKNRMNLIWEEFEKEFDISFKDDAKKDKKVDLTQFNVF